MPTTPTTRRLTRRAMVGVPALLALLATSACDGSTSAPHTSASQSLTTAHDSAWIDSAIALVGTQSGHDPVVEVAIDPQGATVSTRHADSRVQRRWRVLLDPQAVMAGSPTPQATVTPKPLPTPATAMPRATSSRTRAGGSASASSLEPGSAAVSESAPGRSTSSASATASSTRSASPTPVFATPSYAPATPTVPDKVDNSLGNMSLGAFGDTVIRPLWTLMAKGGCGANGWTITATGTWSGSVVSRGTCVGRTITEVNGEFPPHSFDASRNAALQAGFLASLTPNEVSRVLISHSGLRNCPTAMTADYIVGLGGPLHLRTTVTCRDVTTVVLSNGWLPPNHVQPSAINAKGMAAVQHDLVTHHSSLSAVPLRVQWSDLYGEVVVAPSTSVNGRPTYRLDGTPLK